MVSILPWCRSSAIVSKFKRPDMTRIQMHCKLSCKVSWLLRCEIPALAKKIDYELAMAYVQSVQSLIEGINSSSIKAIGCHGQTLLHCPDAVPPFSWQAGDSTILANQTGIPVVSNFREADMQAGGQGAPLATRFHQYAFSSNSESLAIVNIGGIANVTYLPSDKSKSVIGFDTGPGNVLSDAWTKLHRGHEYDEGGTLGAFLRTR